MHAYPWHMYLLSPSNICGSYVVSMQWYKSVPCMHACMCSHMNLELAIKKVLPSLLIQESSHFAYFGICVHILHIVLRKKITVNVLDVSEWCTIIILLYTYTDQCVYGRSLASFSPDFLGNLHCMFFRIVTWMITCATYLFISIEMRWNKFSRNSWTSYSALGVHSGSISIINDKCT